MIPISCHSLLVILGAAYNFAIISSQNYVIGLLATSCKPMFNIDTYNEYSWPASLNLLFCYFAIAYGFIVSRFDLRLVSIIAACITTLCLLVSAMTTSFTVFIISYGVVGSICMGIACVVTLEVVNAYVDDHNAKFSNTLLTCFTPLFGALAPLWVNYVSQNYGCRQSLVVLACLDAQVILTSCLFSPKKNKKKQRERAKSIETASIEVASTSTPTSNGEGEELSKNFFTVFRRSLNFKHQNSNFVFWTLLCSAPVWFTVINLFFAHFKDILEQQNPTSSMPSFTLLTLSQLLEFALRLFFTIMLSTFKTIDVFGLHAVAHVSLALCFMFLPFLIAYLNTYFVMLLFTLMYSAVAVTVYASVARNIPRSADDYHRATFFGLYHTFLSCGSLLFYLFSLILDLTKGSFINACLIIGGIFTTLTLPMLASFIRRRRLLLKQPGR